MYKVFSFFSQSYFLFFFLNPLSFCFCTKYSVFLQSFFFGRIGVEKPKTPNFQQKRGTLNSHTKKSAGFCRITAFHCSIDPITPHALTFNPNPPPHIPYNKKNLCSRGDFFTILSIRVQKKRGVADPIFT